MRFEEIFEDYTFEHWKEYYLDYKLLDKLIDQITLNTNIIIRQSSFIESDAIGRTASIPTSNHEFEISEISEHKFRRKSLDDTDNITLTMTEPFLNKTQSISSKPLYMDEEEKELAKQTLPLFSNYKNFGQWNIVLKKQLDKLDAFYKRKLNDLLKFSELVLKTFDDIEKDENEESHVKDVDELSGIHEVGALGIKVLLSKKLSTKCPEYKPEELLKLMRVSRYEFANIERIKDERDMIKMYVAQHFTDGDKHDATDILRQTNEAIDVKESIIISYLFGVITSALLVMIFQLYTIFNSNSTAVFFASFSVYRFCFEVLLAFWYAAIARYILRLKHLNYFFVLDIRPKNLGEFPQIVRVLTIGTFVYLFYLGLDLYFTSVYSGSQESSSQANFPGLLLFITFGTFIFFPKKSWLREFRYGLLKTILECCFAPFTQVTFLHILVADCLTSMNKVFVDILNSTCWVYEQQWQTLYANYGCTYSPQAIIIIQSLPYYIRFMQCLRRYYDTGLVFPNLWNAAKYGFGIATIILSNLLSLYPNLTPWFLAVGSISYCFNNYWDFRNDWGLFRIWSGKKIFLRERLKFRRQTYYTLICTNLILRLGWLASFLPKQLVVEYFNDPNLFILITVSAEITRRFLWAILRIENEIENNTEKLRDINRVPTIFHFKGKKKRIQPI